MFVHYNARETAFTSTALIGGASTVESADCGLGRAPSLASTPYRIAALVWHAFDCGACVSGDGDGDARAGFDVDDNACTVRRLWRSSQR